MNKIYLIDGMGLVFRSYHALLRMDLMNLEGEPSGAVFGFANLINSFLEREKPENVAVVFDCREPTFRHKMYPDYKANRAAFPEDLGPQIPKIKKMIELLGIPQFEKPGFEADDIIGTLAKNASKQNIEVLCLTSDKDYYQLVDEHISLMKPISKGGGFEYVTIHGVVEKFGVTPDRVVDVMALWGDSSDNIPGVKGVGEKTAIPLIQEFGSLENLFENLDKVERKSVKTKLENDKEKAFLSKKLVTIDINVDCDNNLDSLIRSEPDYFGLTSFFKKEGMNSLHNKWFEKGKHLLMEDDRGDIPQANQQEELIEENTHKTIKDYENKYILIDEPAQLDDLVKKLELEKEFAIDLETTGLDSFDDDIVGVAIAIKPFTAYYIAVSVENDEPSMDLFAVPKKEFKALTRDTVIKKLKPILENENIGKYGQNIKFDALFLRKYGVNIRPLIFDSMLASYLLASSDKHNLDELSNKYLEYSPVPISSLIGEKKKGQRSMGDIEPAEIKDYACEDADLALRLKNILAEKLEVEKLSKLANEIEFPMINVLINIEKAGVSINKTALAELSLKLGERLMELRDLIYVEAACEFNIDSPKQLGHILFEKLMIPTVKKTKTGFSTDVEVLTKLAPTYEIAEYLLEYRTLQKLKSTYIDSLPKLIRKQTNRIHTTFNQHIAGTGRLTSTAPNLQNIPIRTALGKEIRKAFIPSDKEHILLAADYSQIELRIMAYMCGDEQMIQSFKDGLDIHTATAATLFDKEIDEVDSDERRSAKTVNFGIMYGLGVFGLSQRLDIARKKAKEIIDNYFLKFPCIKKYMDSTVETLKEKGFVETQFGRRRHFPEIYSKSHQRKAAAERAAINMPIQGTAADMLKIAMINIDKELEKRNLKTQMILQVHDELVFDVYKEELEEVKELVMDKMVNAMSLGDVPVVVEMGVGENWFEAH